MAIASHYEPPVLALASTRSIERSGSGRIDLHLPRYAAQREVADRAHRAGDVGGEGCRREDWCRKLLRQRLQPACVVDSRAHDGEVEAVVGPNIAELDLAQMEGEAEAQG